jgi:serine/threonine-protein kinase
MTPERYQRLKSLFLAMCDRPAAEQAAAVAALSDEEMRGELLGLLREHVTAQGRERFPAGTVLAGRYRVVVPLGAGGMGEVYRADDLTLDQPVALKFLNGLGGADHLAGLRHEVRVAREVTHANVCRVFDLVESEGEPFLTMELVEGGSLADLLRRIGRLPREKAEDIARQLCDGLAAIHARGLLHRDLKPGNVMLDDRGRVRIADFGLAGPAGAAQAAGTPAYMAPELLAGGAASVQSDLYALGLVLYEVFTGRPAFPGHEQRQRGVRDEPAHPSTLVDLDPRVERAVMRCLEADPARRPASVLAVAAALPGGDPLAAALAAGETPDPNLVAAAEQGGALSRTRARLALGAVLAGLVLIVLLADRTLLVSQVHLPRPPAVLVDRAQEVLRDLPPAGTVLDRAHGLAGDEAYHRQVLGKRRSDASPQGLARFWYREGPRWLYSRDGLGMVTLDEPARFQHGMRTVQLDGSGRLVQLELVPDERLAAAGAPAGSPAALDALFRAAGLERGRFIQASPTLVPPLYADTRLAWTGSDPSRPGLSLRVEAATLAGQPVFFTVREPWQDGERAIPGTLAGWLGEQVGHLAFQALVFVVLLGVAVWLAVRNVRGGRGDRHGARWLGGVVFATGLGGWLLTAHHLPSLTLEFTLFLEALGRNLASAALVWVFYLALEPEVRRIRPQAEISWARLLAGRWRDPLVASHVLLGGLAGVVGVLLLQGERLATDWLNLPLFFPEGMQSLPLLGRERPPATVLLQIPDTLLQGLLVLLVLVLFQRLLRRGWLASLAVVALVTVAIVDWQGASLLTWACQALGAGLVVLALARWGLLAALAAIFFEGVLSNLPISHHLGTWYASATVTAVGLLAGLAVAGYVLSARKASELARAA